jgi:hypothetical protein
MLSHSVKRLFRKSRVGVGNGVGVGWELVGAGGSWWELVGAGGSWWEQGGSGVGARWHYVNTYKDFTFKDFTYKIYKYDITYFLLFAVISNF